MWDLPHSKTIFDKGAPGDGHVLPKLVAKLKS
jgi:hypothetical protein